MMGSQSSRIAAHKLGLDYVGCEIDKTFFDKGNERFERECHHTVTAPNGKKLVQLTMFGM
jgi:site-specific DNA-methyltransferase (adenine-specific)